MTLFTGLPHRESWFERMFLAPPITRTRIGEYVCEVNPGDTVHACACGNHVFTLPSLRFIHTARDGKSYVITPTWR